MVSIGNKKYRNLQEQVGYNTECIQELAEAIDGITLEDKLVIIANDSGTFTEKDMTVLNGPLAFISDGSKVWLKQSETVSEFVFKAIDIVATEVGGTYFNIGGSKIVVTRATRAYVTSDDVIIATYSKTQIEALLTQKASLSGADFTGGITAPNILETMSGYSFNKTTKANITNTLIYVGASKTGNKLTLVIFGSLNRSDTVSGDFISLGNFIIPTPVYSKIYPTALGSIANAVYSANIRLFDSPATSTTKNLIIVKDNSGGVNRLTPYLYLVNSLTASTDYQYRLEITFLLGDNLAE